MPVSPGPLLLLALLAGLYVRAVKTLGRRGYTVPTGQRIAFGIGLGCWALALAAPTTRLSEDLFTAHMAEHLLLAEIGAPLILVGIRSPVLVFLLPRPALVTLARRRRLRALLRWLRQPHIALMVYAVLLYGWHLRFAFEGALRNELVHGLQHQSFIAISLLVWWPALDPKRRRTPGELWKMLHIFAARLLSMFLGVAFVAMSSAAYIDYYGQRARDYGLSPLQDQRTGAGIMMLLDTIIIMFAVTFFFWRSASDWDKSENAAEVSPGEPRDRAPGGRVRSTRESPARPASRPAGGLSRRRA